MRNRVFWILVLVAICSALTACAGQNKEVVNAGEKSAMASQVDMGLVAQELERIKFAPDTSAMPDVGAWIDKANQNVAAAQFVVSMMYRDNIGVEHIEDGKVTDQNVNIKRELNRWLWRSEESEFILADLSHNPSLAYRGEDRQRGDETTLAEAVEWLETAANHGYGNSEFVLGLMYYNGVVVEKDTTRGRELILRAASHHVPNAQYYIGMMYELGLNGAEDLTRSLPWLTYAAQNGNEDAKFILTMKYRDGIGVAPNMEKSEEWRKDNTRHHIWSALLAYLGEFNQLCWLEFDRAGVSYAYGDGCNGEDGYPWDENLSEEENERIRNDYYLNDRTKDSLDYSVDYGIAAKWLDKVTEKGENYNAGILKSQTIFLSGCHGGIEFDNGLQKEQATEKLLNRVCAEETPDCQFYKASLYHNSIFIDHDDNENCQTDSCKTHFAQDAFDMYQKAANSGNRDAMKMLGMIYKNIDDPSISENLGINEDLMKSYDWLLKADDGNNNNEMLAIIAFEIAEGKSLPENINWYQKSVEYGGVDAIYELAKIYRNKEYSGHDDAKSTEYMRQYLTSKVKNRFLGRDNVKEIMLFAQNLKYGTNGASKDEVEALKWYKVGVEVYNDMNDQIYDYLSEDELSRFEEGRAEIEKLESIDGLPSAVEQSIREDGEQHSAEMIEQFKKACVKDYDECHEKLMPIYEKVAPKAVKSVIALALSQNDNVSDELIKNSLYRTAIYQARLYKNRLDYIKQSKYCNLLIGNSTISNDYSSQYAMYIIWYLSHLSSAAEKMYYEKASSNGSSESVPFDSYLKKADEYIKTHKSAQQNYNYNYLNVIQPYDILGNS